MVATANPGFRTQLADRRRRQLSDAIGELRVLPTTVGVPMKILQLQRRKGSSLAEFGAAVSADPSLTTKVLGLANSACCAPGRTITKVTEAIVLIGLKNLLSLVFGISIAGIFNKMGLPSAESKSLWKASLLKAIVAREFSAARGSDESEEAFICGLIQDISLPLIYTSDPSAWPELVAILDMDPAMRRLREEAMYGTDHPRLGRAVALRMGLPELFQFATGLHHESGEAMKVLGDPVLASAIELAATMPHRTSGFSHALAQRLALKLGAVDPANEATHPDLLQKIAADYASTLSLLGESDESSTSVKEFLQALSGEVALCLESAIRESQSQISDLKAREVDLRGKVADLRKVAQQSEYDSLTKALSRRGFMTRAERFFALAREYETACAVGFVDVDNFKRINDQLGHAVGDVGLITVAERLVEAVKGKGIVGRVGGDEFAFLMLVKSKEEITAEAERLTAMFTGMTLGEGGRKLPLTTSIGLLWIGIPAADRTPEMTLKSADEVMYGVKRSGKGKCLVGEVV